MGEHINWTAYFALLAKAGFHGPVSLHLEYEMPGATPRPKRKAPSRRRRRTSLHQGAPGRAYV